jgi:CubicO group peptidase (beta-lactamase class C family)
VRDLLTHRSGLGPGAGDLMFYPATDFSRAEIIRGLRYLKSAASFRSRFDYDNLLYIVAGEVIAAVAGQSWEDFTERRIFQPLQMSSCAASYERLKDRSNVASAHAVVNGKLVPVPATNLTVVGAAGTINCSVNDMSKWLLTQLAAGRTASGQSLFSADRSAEMWSMNTIKPLDPELAALTRTHFSGYGLGWDLQDTFGRKRVSHTGGVPGMVTWVSMIPELSLGVLVLTNQQSEVAIEVLGNQILDAYLGAPRRDWVQMGIAFEARQPRKRWRIPPQPSQRPQVHRPCRSMRTQAATQISGVARRRYGRKEMPSCCSSVARRR